MFALKRSAVGVVAVLVIGLGAPVGARAEEMPTPLPAPSVTTLAATGVSATMATFHAKVVTNNTSTTVHFVYGTAPDQLTHRVLAVAVGSASGETTLDASVKFLSANTRYYVMAVAENDDWVVTGDIVSLSTLALPEIIGSSVGDITYNSATLHLSVATHGQPVTVSGIARAGISIAGSGRIPFGPYPVAADGDLAIPLPALRAGTNYSWSAKATSVAGDSTPRGTAIGTARGTFRTEALIKMPKPTLTPAVATYGSSVRISGTIPGKPGLVVTLANQPYPFYGPIAPLAGVTATTDATGAYTFDIRAKHTVAYGVTADGSVPLTARDLAKLKIAPAVIAKVRRARHHRFAVAGHFRPAITSQVSLYRRGAGRVGVARESEGTFHFSARVLKPGKYEVRIVPDDFTEFARAKSATIAIPRR